MTVIFLGKTAFICGQADNFLHLTHNEVFGNNVMRGTVTLEGHLQRLNRSEVLGESAFTSELNVWNILAENGNCHIPEAVYWHNDCFFV